MKLVFMGTSTFAVPSLERLWGGPHTLLAVVTQPDRPRGRGRQMAFSPVKQVALAHQLPLLQPPRASDPGFLATLAALGPEAVVVVAYGQLLPPALLAIPPYGCVNVHASLLPKYRGAAPIHWALIRGERTTGVTIMLIDATLDTGPVLLQAPVEIAASDNAQTLQERLASRGADALLQALAGLEAGTLQPTAQAHEEATYAPKLRKEDGIIRWQRSANELANLIRGVTPWPGAMTTHRGRSLRIWRTSVTEGAGGDQPGRVINIDKFGVGVATGAGQLVLHEVQPAGSRRMDAGAYVRGHALLPGEVLGTC